MTTETQNKPLQIQLEREEAEAEALERGRTIGRLEGLVQLFLPAEGGTRLSRLINEADAAVVLPILRAEIERLRAS